MKIKSVFFLCFLSLGIIFGQNAENLNDELSAEQVFDKIKEYILNNNSDALWELYEGTDTSSANTFEELFLKKTTNEKKMTFEKFSELIGKIYAFTQENHIKNFNFGNVSERGSSIDVSSGLTSVSEKIRKCATLTPLYFNLFSDENFSLPSSLSEIKYNICVEIKKSTLGFRITSFYTETNYLARDFDLLEYIKNNFRDTEGCFISVNVLKPKQRILYSFFGEASRKDIEIVNKLGIINYEENPITLNVDELYIFSIVKLNQSKYVGLIFSEIDNKALIVVDGKYGLFETESIEMLRTYTEDSRKR